jgi:phage-related minor tail protein
LGSPKLFTSEEATKAKTAIDKLRASFSPLYAAEMELKEGTEIVNEALRTQSTDTETQTMLMAKLGEQYRLAYAEANFDKLKDFDAAQAGAAQGFKDFTESIGSEAQIWAEGMTNAFDMATDALMTFATTGKFNIKQFARTMIAELQKVILKLLLVKALEAAAGAFGAGGSLSGIAGSAGPAISGALSGLAGGFSGRAAGGPVATGKPYMVGEKGPEMFVPPSGGSIKNNNSLDMKPQVNVSVVNVDDPSSVPNAMATQAGEEVVLNILQRNSDVLREMA